MNFHQLASPIPKRISANCSLKPFPVDAVLEEGDEKPFVGIFNGLSIEIIDSEAIKRIYSNGCFGLSTKSKSTPQALISFLRAKNVSQTQYDRKLAWNAKFGNQNPNSVLPQAQEIIVNDIPVADPFPIEEVLALLPEEAFFLHFSLRCLKVVDFDQTHEFTTLELLEKFCALNPKFIEQYIVYHYYRCKNWVVKSGLKFGGDFLLYYKGPSFYHASYVVLVSGSDDQINHLDMQSNYRVADSTNKELILVTVTRPSNLEYSNRKECLDRIKEFRITEVLPKRFLLNQLNTMQSKS